MASYEIIKSGHALIGTLALLSFWTAGLSRKGSPLHKTAGKIYLLAMLAIIVTALGLTAMRWLRGDAQAAAFFGYLSVITATACWISWRAIRDKRDFARFSGPVFKLLIVLNLLSGLGILLLGLSIKSILFSGFSLVGIQAGVNMLRQLRNGPEHALWWREAHINAMLGNGVATHIAFLLIGLPKLLPSLVGPKMQLFGWFAPLVVALLVRLWLTRKYPVPKSVVSGSIRTAAGGVQPTTAQSSAPAR